MESQSTKQGCCVCGNNVEELELHEGTIAAPPRRVDMHTLCVHGNER